MARKMFWVKARKAGSEIIIRKYKKTPPSIMKAVLF